MIDINRKLYWSVLFHPIAIIVYAYGIRTLWQLCQYGGIRRRAPVILGIGIAGLIWIVAWTIIYFVCKKQENSRRSISTAGGNTPVILHIILAVEITALVLCTGFYGFRIYRSSVAFNGKLAWYLDEKRNSRQISLTENNFYENGIDGVLSALKEELDIEQTEDIYISGDFQLSIDEKGNIRTIETLLYMQDENHAMKGYLISYDADADEDMTVWLNGDVYVDYPEQRQLKPMQEMISALRDSTILLQGKCQYSFRYEGYTRRSYEPGWYLLSEDRLTAYPSNNYGMSLTGYMMTVFDEYGSDITIVSSVDTLQTIDDIEQEQQAEAERKQAEEAGSSLVVDNESGTMTFYLDEENSMSLHIIDAAAGSRWYAFSSSAGITNNAPFGESGGVAESIYFMDTDKGFILLSGASFDHSSMFYTENGGADFTEVSLPMEDARTDLESNPYSFEVSDFDYIDVPYEENDVLYVKVGINSLDMAYVAAVFRSEDEGKTWVYDRVDVR